jgi:hypothetical protein
MRTLNAETMTRTSLIRSTLMAGAAAALAISALTGTTASAMVPEASSQPANVLMAADADGRAVEVTTAVTAGGRQGLAAEVAGNLVAVHSGKCLDVVGGPTATGNGVPIQQWDCLGSTQANQIWNIQNEIYAGGYYYYNLVAAHGGKCLDVVGGPTATGNGVPIQQWDCLGSDQTNQQWRLVTTKLGLRIIARHSGKCLDVTGGTGATDNGVAIQQWDCLGITQTNQLWYRY